MDYLHLTLLDGSKTSVSKQAIVGVEASTEEVTYTVEERDEEKPVEEEPEGRGEKIAAGVGIAAKVALFVAQLVWTAIDPDYDGPASRKREPETKTVEYPITIIHVKTGKKTRRIAVKEEYGDVMRELES